MSGLGGLHMGGCQKYGPFLRVLNIKWHLVFRGPIKGDQSFDNHPHLEALGPGADWAWEVEQGLRTGNLKFQGSGLRFFGILLELRLGVADLCCSGMTSWV